MAKYIVLRDSVINVDKFIRFTANPDGEIKIECEDGISARLAEGTYRGKELCDKMRLNFIRFIQGPYQFWLVEEGEFSGNPYYTDGSMECIK